ncbi:MAG: polyisoprenyl-teichoic acid--peptidoglycan teichoic acid transferase [Nocardioidaceae bacterium]|jgi:LCP family protein required for cell wall assembly|nr:polyisoprenyl-teichoic acid--peptidoglycan teichoic acid transferase [Nocardioidaceae bacterium]
MGLAQAWGRSGGQHAPGDRSFAASLGLTVLGAIVPGSGFWFAGRRRLGAVVFVVALAGLVTALLLGLLNPRLYLHSILQPSRLVALIVAFVVVAIAWMAIIMFSHLELRPRRMTTWQRIIGVGVAIILCFAVATPFAVGARYAYATRDFITHVFPKSPVSKTTPKNESDSNPWAGQRRVNILLLGGDGGVLRQGVRTDSMIVASIDTTTGNTVLFSLPRNLQSAPFPPGSALARLYPNGFNGAGDEGNWLLNAVYRMVPLLHPGILGATDNEGADALKMSISQILGLHVDYYVLINLQGFVQMVNALGGITVNINQIVPIGGNLDSGVPPTGWIQPGPNKHLDGWHALWFARGRWNTDDYHRMQNQRCVIDAVIHQMSPTNVLLRYQQIAAAGTKIARTDIPQELLPALVDLGLKVKDAKLSSVVFQPNAHFNPVDPNFTYMRSVVQNALHPSSSGGHRPKIIQRPQSACAYHPVG